MKFTVRPLSIWVTTFLLLASIDIVQGQRLHDEARDKEAKKAAQLAEEITSKSSFEKQLKNLDTLSKHALEVYFAGAKRQMELDIRSLRTWGDVQELTERVQDTLLAEDFVSSDVVTENLNDLKRACPRVTDLGKSICKAKEDLERLNEAVRKSEEEGKRLDKELKSRLEKIDTIDDLVEKTTSFLISDRPDQSATINELADVFLNLSRSYLNYISKLDTINKPPQNDLRLLLQRIAVEALLLEVDHWKTVSAIKMRRSAEQSDLRYIANVDLPEQLRQISKCFSIDTNSLNAEKIPVTFEKARAMPACRIEEAGAEVELAKEEIVVYLLMTLHNAAALAARGETPMKIAELRLAEEEHRFSIRHSAVMARTYEVTFTSGTNRLARFYAGGLKPEKIAQLIHSAAAITIPTAIAVK